MRVLVTGGAGFIGSHLTEKLLERGDEVGIVDSMEPQVHGDSPFGMTCAEMTDFKGFDAIVHLAAVVGVGQSMYEMSRYVERNTLDTARFLENIVQSGHRPKLVVASSMSVYGEGTLQGVREFDPLSPTSIYAITKRDQEELCLVAGKAYGFPVTALRFFNTYGPGQSLSNPYTGVIAIFASQLMNGRQPVIYGDGTQTRDFIHVSDIVRGIIAALDTDSAAGHAINLGTGRPTSVNDVALKLGETFGVDVAPEYVGERAGDIQSCYADTFMARYRLGFKAEMSLEFGIRDLVSWLKTQEAEDRTEQSHAELLAHGLVR